MKKTLYLLLITGILIAPIGYWLITWWGVDFSHFPSFARFKYIYSQDRFLSIATSINSVLYLFAIYKIIFSNPAPKQKKDVSEERSVVVNQGTNDNITKWDNLYGPNRVVNATSPTATERNDAIPTPTPSQNSREQQRVVERVEVEAEPPQAGAKVEKSNIINMTEPVSAMEVYQNQINNVLEDNGYAGMGACVINNIDVDFIAVAESDTLVVGIINTEYGDIIANETPSSDSEVPSWFTNERKYPSPVWEIKTVQKAVNKMINEVLPPDNGIVVKPVVVIPNANVANQLDMEAKWNEMGVSVARFLNHSGLPNLIDVLPDKKETEVLESYKTFVKTLIKYFSQKNRKYPMKKAG